MNKLAEDNPILYYNNVESRYNDWDVQEFKNRKVIEVVLGYHLEVGPNLWGVYLETEVQRAGGASHVGFNSAPSQCLL